jgi:hypothetical protein
MATPEVTTPAPYRDFASSVQYDLHTISAQLRAAQKVLFAEDYYEEKPALIDLGFMLPAIEKSLMAIISKMDESYTAYQVKSESMTRAPAAKRSAA